MATSDFAVGTLRTHTSGEAVSPTDLMYNLNLIRDGHNDSLDTATGHYHPGGSDSRSISGGITGWTFEDIFLLMLGSFGKGGL